MKRMIILLPALLLAAASQAQQAAATTGSGSNFLEIFMATVAIVLVFVIWGLSSILGTFARQVLEKQQEGSGKTIAIVAGLLLLAPAAFAQQAADVAAAPVTTPFNYGGLSATSFWLLAAVILTEFIVVFVLVYNIQRLHKALTAKPVVAAAPAPVKESRIMRTWQYLDKRFFTKAAEKDADVMLDHDYDGIHELDNALPPWWKYGFYITVALAVVYLLRFHVWGDGPTPEQEYATEMNKAHQQIQAYMEKTKDLVDESNVAVADAAGVEAGQAIYMKTCVACHGQKGEGGVGPNLTDDYWIHGGSVTSIFKTIKYGFPEKGMQSWQSQYTPKQMQQLSSFIKTLRGTNPPNAKAPQGELYQEGNATPQPDSAAAKEIKTVALLQQ